MQTFWILSSSLLFATMSLLVKLAAQDFSIPEIIFFRTMPGVLLLIIYARLRRLPLLPRARRIHAARVAAGMASMCLGFYAISRLSLATATSLDYTAPIFMMLYVVAVSRHRPSVSSVAALLGGFGGVLLLLRPTLQAGESIPFLAGLGGGALAAIAYLQVWRLGQAGEPEWRSVLVYSATAMTLSAVALPFGPSSTYSIGGLLTLAGVGGTGLLAQLAMTRAYTIGVPTRVATLQYSTVVFAAIYGYVVWDDLLSLPALGGLALVAASGMLAVRNVQRPQDPRPTKSTRT